MPTSNRVRPAYNRGMGRFRMYPTPAQKDELLEHCRHARFMWNLAVEQLNFKAHTQWAPGYAEQNIQLTEARGEFAWLAAGSSMVQQQSLRDFSQAVANWRGGTHRKPRWHKRGKHEGFRVVGDKAKRVRHLNRRWSQVSIPKIGWVRFRRTCAVPDAKSYRVTLDAAGRWHIGFTSVPSPISGPQNGTTIGIDMGVAVALTLSDGTTYQAPPPINLRHAARKLSRCKRGSNRRIKARIRLAKLHARDADRRKNFIETTSTRIAQNYDLIRVEDLRVKSMTGSARGTIDAPGRNVKQKSGLNRSIRSAGWSMFFTRLGHKALGRIEKVHPAFTSQRCSVCGHVAAESRKSQALFRCVACGHTSNADLNAARNIAAERAVTARGAGQVSALNREPQQVDKSPSCWNLPDAPGERTLNRNPM